MSRNRVRMPAVSSDPSSDAGAPAVAVLSAATLAVVPSAASRVSVAAAGSGRPGGTGASAAGSVAGTGVGVMSADPCLVSVASPGGSDGSASVSATGGS
jgi:hypothetical protein